MKNEDLVEKIERVRQKMIAAGMTEGLTSQETIKLSETLDELLNLSFVVLSNAKDITLN
ncbi:aspartyl-phosphate phosphatase Spo0E family protein [Neobacillus pocheonensis]|uniref:Aspartyl-phosphate phosphatase Spo0E family protein n=1 Tax=Neobacillus pocheonensis TaxID=363869 RepID=A0ABT0WK97_9BACI|nr:aspartyl-phosphate phosphatase Spo0E family protein [Neobacillus pocheonensis]